jgi:hypothetical protein
MVRAASLAIAVAVLAVMPLQAPAQDSDEIQALLDARAEAVARKDLKAFMATVDPGNEEFRASQEAWFRRFVQLPVEGYSLTSTLPELGELTRAQDRERHGNSAMVVRVDERYRLAGYDRRADLNQLVYTFVSRSGNRLIAGDTALDDLGLFSERQPWDFGDILVLESEHFLAVFHPGDRTAAQSTLQQAEQGLTQVGRGWPREWSRRSVIYIPAGVGELEGLLGVVFDVSNFVAFAASAVDLAEAWDLVGYRVVVNPANFLRYGPRLRTEILAHELVHVATRESSGPFVPNWVEEGIAQLAESTPQPDLGPLVASGRFTATVPEDYRFTSGSNQDIFQTYRESLSALAFMRDTFGLEEVGEYYAALGRARIEPGTGDYHVNRAMREVLGMGIGEFQTAWLDSVRG